MDLFRKKRTLGVAIQNMEAVVDFMAEPRDWKVYRLNSQGEISFQWVNQGFSAGPPRFADASLMRDTFLAVKTPEQAEDFLSSSGPFRADASEVTWANFQRWQEYFKRQRRLITGYGAPPESSFAGYRGDGTDVIDKIARTPKLDILKEGPRDAYQIALAARCDSVVEAIAATNWLEKLARIKVISCLHCKDPFAPATKRAVYCGHACAHAAGQKRRAALKA